MNLPDVLLLGLFLVLGLLGFLVILFALMYFKLRDELDKTLAQWEQDKQDQQQSQESAVVVEQAQQEARRIIQEASAKASEIIKEARFLSDTVKTKLEADLTRLPQAQEDIYRQVFVKVGEEAVGILHKVAQDMKLQAQQQTQEFGIVLQQQAVGSQEEVKKSINAIYESLEDDVKKYKLQRYQQIDKAVHRVIEDIVRSVLGRAITMQEHEQLILQALEEAKKEHAL